MLTQTQKRAAEAIVNLFETGEVRGVYGEVTVLQGDTGHLSFGRSQTTLGSGGLHAMLARYCANQGARFAAALAPYLPRFEARDVAVDLDFHLHNLLRASADDPVMRDTQDAFFDEGFWQPAERIAARELTPPTSASDRGRRSSWDRSGTGNPQSPARAGNRRCTRRT